jgi:hypothetical protein
MDALKGIPKNPEKIKTKEGIAYLRKTDIFKKELTYNLDRSNKYYKLSAEDVSKLLSMNKSGEFPASLDDFTIVEVSENKELEDAYQNDLVGSVSLQSLEKSTKKKKKKNNNQRRNKNRPNNNNSKNSNKQS